MERILPVVSAVARCTLERIANGQLISHGNLVAFRLSLRKRSRLGQRSGIHALSVSAILRYRITQQPPPSPFSNLRSAARVAASKTSSTPSPLKLEHSR